MLNKTKTYDELLVKQKKMLEAPSSNEFDYFLEVTKPEDLVSIREKVISIVST